MKLKLTKDEFIAITEFLHVLVFDRQATTMQTKLVLSNLETLFYKFHKRIVFMRQSHYGITMTTPEALAFWVISQHLQQMEVPVNPFTGNLLHQINSKIHQKYS